MKEKFSIRGVDLKSEILIGLSIIPFILLMSFLVISSYHSLTNIDYKNIPFYIVIGGMILGMMIGLFFARLIGRKMSSYWNILLVNEDLSIEFKNQKWSFNLSEITKLKIYGNPNFKYVSFWINNKKPLRMRIGNSGLTPFSDKHDMGELEKFIDRIEIFYSLNYTKIDNKLKQSPAGTVKLTYKKK